jgi:hypothetical protein
MSFFAVVILLANMNKQKEQLEEGVINVWDDPITLSFQAVPSTFH